jgi:hypothetical protein
LSSIVEYILNLKGDNFNSGLAAADANVNKLESSIGKIGVAFAAVAASAAVFSFVGDSVAMFNEAEAASAQLNATLTSTGNIAGLNREALDKQALSMMRASTFDDDAITKAQGLLATFTQIKSDVFMQAIPAIADLATKMGTDLNGAAIQVGKALNDPIQGMSALRRIGVSFSKDQQEVIKNLVETNQLAEAQTMILKELSTEFGGSAAAALNTGAGQLQLIRNEFNNVREEIGGMAMALIIELKPALVAFVEAVSTAVTWIKEHKEGIGAVVKALGAAAGVFYIVVPAIKALGAAAALSTIELEFMAGATLAALGPIGLLVAALGALTFGYAALTQAQADNERQNKAMTENANEALVSSYVDRYEAMYKKSGLSRAAFLAQEREDIQNAQKKVEDYNREALLSGGKTKDVSNMLLASEALDRLQSGDKAKALTSASTQATSRPPKVADKATGSKSVTINVTIGDLVKTLNINTTNIKEGAARIKEMVEGSLMGAINDFQITAGGK